MDGFSEAAPDLVIDNLSVGGSPGVQFLRFADFDFSQYACVIFDSAVNDENHLPYLGDIQTYSKYMLELFSLISDQTNLLALGFRNQHNISAESDVFRVYRDMCEQVGGKFVCVNSWVFSNLDVTDDIYDDMAHIRREIAYKFGQSLADLKCLRQRKIITRKPQTTPFKVFHGNEASRFQTSKKTNSKFAVEIAVSSLGSEIIFPRRMKALGILMDYRGSYGALKFHNSKGITGQNFLYAVEDRLVLKFVPFWGGGVDCDGVSVVEPGADYAISPENAIRTDQPIQLAIVSVVARELD